MKKILTIILLIALLSTNLFAATYYTEEPWSVAFEKTSPKVTAMGGSGIALKNVSDAIYLNPASLAQRGGYLSLASASVSIFQVANIYNSSLVQNLINNGKLNNDTLISDSLALVLPTYGSSGAGQIAVIDGGVGLKLGSFALAADAQVSLPTYNKDSNATTLNVYPKVDAVVSTGFATRFLRDSIISLDVGLTARLNVRGYYNEISVDSLLNNVDIKNFKFDTALLGPVSLGFAIPVDVGANLNLPLGITVSAVVRNLNGNFYYMDYADTDSLIKDYSKALEGKTIVKSPWTIDLGAAFNPNLGVIGKVFQPSVSLDLVDTLPLLQEKNFKTDMIFKYLNVGAEVKLLDLISLRAGVKTGCYSVGAGLNLFHLINIDASYYYSDYGINLGENPIDAFTIGFNLGWK